MVKTEQDMNKLNPILKIIALALLISGCVWDSTEKKAEKKIVARVGEEQIAFDHFYETFTLSPHFKPNIPLAEARLQHLQHMIDRVVLADAAEKVGLHKQHEIISHIEYIKNKEMLKQLYREEVLKKVPVEDEELWEEYKRRNL
ncbi:hypothetical protein GWN91_00195, partial [Candidatus Saccharibacteria bacterium]|nr:hypothetical protein [Candidatus Saccharibacteria bacterium]